MPHSAFTQVNPDTTSRERFTNNILEVPIPSNADKAWAEAVRHQQKLYRALYDHQAMAPNRQQTFMTKAASKSRIYHTWDFVGRTLQFLYMCEYDTLRDQKRGAEQEIFADALARTAGSKEMIEDTSGKFDVMLNANIDVMVPYSEEIKCAAGDLRQELLDTPAGWQ
jgi:hypothetical protein